MRKFKLYDPALLAKSEQKVVILAPHADDELIGCYSLLASGRVDYVVYFYEMDDLRHQEAAACASKFHFTPLLFDDLGFPLRDFLRGTEVYLPAITDSHPQHKAINSEYRNCGAVRKYYSVDMPEGKQLLSPLDRSRKRQALNGCYLSQSSLWETNASYYLFEHVRDSDLTHLFKGMTNLATGRAVRYKVPSGTDYRKIRIMAETCVTLTDMANELIHAGIYKFELESHDGEEVIRL